MPKRKRRTKGDEFAESFANDFKERFKQIARLRQPSRARLAERLYTEFAAVYYNGRTNDSYEDVEWADCARALADYACILNNVNPLTRFEIKERHAQKWSQPEH